MQAGRERNGRTPFQRADAATMVRYAMVMVAGAVVDYLTFLFAYGLISIPAAQFAARLAGAATGFVGHKWFSFRSPGWSVRRTGRQLFLYVLLWISNYLVSTWAIVTLVAHYAVAAPLAKIMVELAIVPLTYMVIRNYIFPTRRA